MDALPIFPLADLADTFANHLFAEELRERLAHHLSHGTAERWLHMELAYSVNKHKVEGEVKKWVAVLERKNVDVTLVPLEPASNRTPPISIECMMVGPSYWSVWHGIESELTGRSSAGSRKKKPVGDYVVCFSYDYSRANLPNVGPKEREHDRLCLASIPDAPGVFTPYLHTYEFVLLHTSRTHFIEWSKPILGRWDHGFAIDLRILWIAKPCQNSL